MKGRARAVEAAAFPLVWRMELSTLEGTGLVGSLATVSHYRKV